ncbi:MAG TPA: hypothetical protein VL738_28375 [Dactylosporangium sp.]|nr:hypothetical protein [Dactylosporangium sp.]
MTPFDEDDAGGDLRALMLAVEVPDSGADVQRAITTGRRARRRTAVMSAATAVVVFAAVGTFVAFGPMRAGPPDAPAASATPAAPLDAAAICSPAALDLPPGSADASTTTIDPAGRIVGGYADEQQPKPVVWRDGRPEVVPGVTGVVTDVASDGTVVGFAVSDQHNAVGWVVRGGKATNLAVPPGYQFATPMAINANGMIVGAVSTAAAESSVPAAWSVDGAVHLLTVPSGVGDASKASTARDVADDGTVVGEVHGFAMMWRPDGTPHVLPAAPNGYGGQAMGIAGHYAYGVSSYAAVRWDLRTDEVAVMRLEGVTNVRAGTASGLALITGDGLGRTVLQAEDGSSIHLNGPNNEFASAAAVSGDGSTIAGTFVVGDVNHPVVWHCG